MEETKRSITTEAAQEIVDHIIPKLEPEVVATEGDLPLTGDPSKVYLVPGGGQGVTTDDLADGIGRIVSVHGNDSNGAIRFDTGTQIAWIKWRNSSTVAGEWGTMKTYHVAATPPNYAVAFDATPTVVAQLNPASANGWLSTKFEYGGAGDKNHPGGYQLVRPTTISGAQLNIDFIAIGRWK